MIIRKRAYARAGLVGNPSDGYFGKTISFTFSNFWAEVTLFETPELEIRLSQQDHSVFDGMKSLVEDVKQNGYYGGVRLMKATIKKFCDYCNSHEIELHGRNFTVRYFSSIPRQVGLAGSSGIVTACLRCLMDFYGVEMPLETQPNVVLSVETEELGIAAGLQDRVIQVYEGLVYMDFAQDLMEKHDCGRYERLDPSLLPRLFIAYRTDLGEASEKAHSDVRARFDRGDPDVVGVMKDLAVYAEQARRCLLQGDHEELGRLMNANFDRRATIYEIDDRNRDMIDRGRALGAHVKFSGSGGAVVGMYQDEEMFEKLKQTYEEGGYLILKPVVVSTKDLPTER